MHRTHSELRNWLYVVTTKAVYRVVVRPSIYSEVKLKAKSCVCNLCHQDQNILRCIIILANVNFFHFSAPKMRSYIFIVLVLFQSSFARSPNTTWISNSSVIINEATYWQADYHVWALVSSPVVGGIGDVANYCLPAYQMAVDDLNEHNTLLKFDEDGGARKTVHFGYVNMDGSTCYGPSGMKALLSTILSDEVASKKYLIGAVMTACGSECVSMTDALQIFDVPAYLAACSSQQSDDEKYLNTNITWRRFPYSCRWLEGYLIT